MTKQDKNCFEDFTFEKYRHYLVLAKKNFCFSDYSNINSDLRFVLWRHDIDFSPQRALRLSKIEYDESVRSTYFVWLHAHTYNVFEKNTQLIIQKIMGYGHDIGLHFDAGFYGLLSPAMLEKHMTWERRILEETIGREISVFSYHNPNPGIVEYRDLTIDQLIAKHPHYFQNTIAGMINAYGRYFIKEVPYCSDSNGYWRYRKLFEVLNDSIEMVPCLQVLLHPVWWSHSSMSPRDRIKSAIDESSSRILENYDYELKTMGRKNIS